MLLRFPARSALSILESSTHGLGVPVFVCMGSIETASYFECFKTSAFVAREGYRARLVLVGKGALHYIARYTVRLKQHIAKLTAHLEPSCGNYSMKTLCGRHSILYPDDQWHG